MKNEGQRRGRNGVVDTLSTTNPFSTRDNSFLMHTSPMSAFMNA